MKTGLGADFSTTVYATPDAAAAAAAAAAGCDPFWTMMNGGYCSDALGNYLRRDGSVYRVGGVQAPASRWFAGVSNEAVMGGAAVVVLLLFLAAVRK